MRYLLKFNGAGFIVEKNSGYVDSPYFSDRDTLILSLELLKEYIRKYSVFYVKEENYYKYTSLTFRIDDRISIYIGLTKYTIYIDETDDYITPEKDINYVHSLIDTFATYL